MPSTWLIALAWIALAVAFASAAVILIDIYARGYRLKMPVMEAVWPVTALYAGPAAVWLYRRYGRTTSARWLRENNREQPPETPLGHDRHRRQPLRRRLDPRRYRR